jgi:hypothetical protein
MSWNMSINIVTSYRLNDWGSMPGKGRIFLFITTSILVLRPYFIDSYFFEGVIIIPIKFSESMKILHIYSNTCSVLAYISPDISD